MATTETTGSTVPRRQLGRYLRDLRNRQRITVKAAAEELVRHLPTQKDKQASLLPPLAEARELGRMIGRAVGRQAMRDGLAQVASEEELERELQANIWDPVYIPYELRSQ